jgi:hypothetical protein
MRTMMPGAGPQDLCRLVEARGSAREQDSGGAARGPVSSVFWFCSGAALALALGACAGHAAPPRPAPKPAPRVASERPPRPPVDSPRVNVARSGEEAYLGVIEREGLVAIVDQGLGRFLQHLRLEPAMRDGKFGGFRLAALDPAWRGVGLESGDLITRLNGQPIERPEQALAAFESLRTASEVRVDFTRDGVPSSVRYRIE